MAKSDTCSLAELLVAVRACTHCAQKLPLGPKPVLSAARTSKILIVGQAPGIRVHHSGVAWDDPSGRRLREWMDIGEEDFYDESKVALVPMGFCYPGTGNSRDLPPRPECAELWHKPLFQHLQSVELTLLLGQYSQKAILGSRLEKTLTATVAKWKEFRPAIFPMPHPSPRNNRWLTKNPWFKKELLPALRRRVKRVINSTHE